jgi:hypothetical protein
VSDSVWASIVSFDEREDDVHDPPLVYLGQEHCPFPTDPRGGTFDIAEIADWQSCLDPVRMLRIAVVPADGQHAAAAVLDLPQVARLYERLGAWLGVDRSITAEDLT